MIQTEFVEDQIGAGIMDTESIPQASTGVQVEPNMINISQAEVLFSQHTGRPTDELEARSLWKESSGNCQVLQSIPKDQFSSTFPGVQTKLSPINSGGLVYLGPPYNAFVNPGFVSQIIPTQMLTQPTED